MLDTVVVDCLSWISVKDHEEIDKEIKKELESKEYLLLYIHMLKGREGKQEGHKSQ